MSLLLALREVGNLLGELLHTFLVEPTVTNNLGSDASSLTNKARQGSIRIPQEGGICWVVDVCFHSSCIDPQRFPGDHFVVDSVAAKNLVDPTPSPYRDPVLELA